MNDIPDSFRALRIHQHDGVVSARFERLQLEQLSAGDVVIRVSHSGINYKDALAASPAGRIVRRFPLVGGIDLAGSVVTSTDPRFRSGDAVLVTGCGLSETRDGGYSEYARVPAEAVIAMPAGFDGHSAMAVGTAGFAAALAIVRMEHNGQLPSTGPIVVTGAAGGVGSLAVDMLAAGGYEVIAVTGKAAAHEYLRALGASSVLTRAELGGADQPLMPARWGGAIDNLGGPTLVSLLAGTRNNGNVASVGLADTAELRGTVMPFILRGVNLLGVNSAATPLATRLGVWRRIERDLRPRHLDLIAQRSIGLDELPGAFATWLQAGVQGRTVVRIS
jgi:acrylyl-CoA reductase (NADPH)